MWIIADCHAYYDQYQYEDQWINHWQGIVARFKDSYDKIIWEPANEPVMNWEDDSHALNGQQAVTELARIYQRWIDMCRGMGDTHWVVVSAVCWWNSLPFEDWFPSVNDPLNKIYLNSHFYYFYEWAQDKWTVADAEANADERFNEVLAAMSKHGRPFLCTEYGATPFSSDYGYDQVPTAQYGGASGYSTVSLAFTQELTRHFNDAGISYVLFPAGEWAKDWSQGWHYTGLYGGMDVWGQYL
jgi:aryl-phospho-beta-D-glucosidase BglC (GH1 family)